MKLEARRYCPVPGCRYTVCEALGANRCFPHSPGNAWLKRWRVDAHNGIPAPMHRAAIIGREIERLPAELRATIPFPGRG